MVRIELWNWGVLSGGEWIWDHELWPIMDIFILVPF